ncbi:MAG: DUF4350 domain-containing protein [Verrucomicrobiales bacterium]|nr:DUF4350 domain-containing protein [Verrucomicrobiales bacterium]
MNRRAAILGLLAVLAVLGAGLWRLFDLRFSTGDIYPGGSSLRADPTGTRAYFESLARIPGREVRRGLLPLSSVRGGAETTLFLLELDPGEPILGKRDWESLNDLLANGGRVVISFAAERNREGASGSGTNRQTRPVTLKGSESLEFPNLGPASVQTNAQQIAFAVRTAAAPTDLPPRIPWPGNVFEKVPEGWTSLFNVNGAPVVIQRALGRGTLVLLASNDLLTNDALRHQRQTALLAWLSGTGTRILFDETHLGTRLDPGILTLVRRYGLGGVLAGLVAVTALALWRATSGLVPRIPAPSSDSREVVLGGDAASGFTQLLRRSVPTDELLPLCVAEWRRSLPAGRPDLERRAEAVQDLCNLQTALPPREQDPVDAYRRMAELLSRN